jgi:PAS domain S-box-containing protein
MRKIDPVWNSTVGKWSRKMSIYEKIDEFRQRLDRYSTHSNHIDEPNIPIGNLIEELSTALEELQVMHEELQVQNEEIETRRAEAVQHSQRYQELFQLAPDAYLVTDEDNVIQEANYAATELLRLKLRFLVGKPISSFVCQKDRQYFRNMVSNINGTTDFEVCIQPRSSSEIIVAVRVAPAYSFSNEKCGYRWILRDITPQKQVQTSLQNSEKRFRNIFNTGSVGTALINESGQIVECNQALVNFLSTDPINDRKETFLTYVYPDDRRTFQIQLQSVMKAESTAVRSLLRFRKESGQMVWGTTSISLLRYLPNEESLVLVMVEDVTDQKRALSEREEMQRRLIDSIEAERVHLARELHDNPLQDLYAVLYEVEGLSQDIVSPESRERFEHLKAMLLSVLNSLRTTSGELRPPTLNRYGLESAVSSFIETMQPLYPNVSIDFVSTLDQKELPDRLALTCYRVIQESMHNVFRHSGASKATIRLIADDRLIVQVEDNGRGFDVQSNMVELMQDGHYGLAGMQERAKAVFGELKIESKPGQGTLIEMNAPLP